MDFFLSGSAMGETNHSSATLTLVSMLVLLLLHTCRTVSGNGIQDFDPFGGIPSFDADDHVRGKRRAAGTVASDTQFLLTRTSGTDTPQIGDVLQYRIDIWLPVVNTSGMALTVEISSANPENRQVGLALCRPVVSLVGNKINSLEAGRDLTLTQPSMFYNPTVPQVNDKAIFNFGLVANNDTMDATNPNSSSLISITFCAALIDSSSNANPVYVTSGGEYADSAYIWVGQDQLTPSYGNRYTVYTNTFKSANNDTLALARGDSGSMIFEAAVTSPWTPMAFGVNTPEYYNYISFGFVGVSFPSTGYFAQNNVERAVTYAARTNYEGAYISRETKFEPLINMRGSNTLTSDPGNKIYVAMSICVSPTAPSTSGITITFYGKLGSAITNINLTANVNGTGPPSGRIATGWASFAYGQQSISTLSQSNVIPPGGAVIFLVKAEYFEINGWFNYTLTVTPPAGFTACGARLEFVGGNIGCIPPLDNKTVTVDNSTGIVVVNFVAKGNQLKLAAPNITDRIQNQIWVAVTISGGTDSGSVEFKDTNGTTISRNITVDASTLSEAIPSGIINSTFENQKWYSRGQIAYDVAINLPANYPLGDVVFEASGDPTGTAGFEVQICRATVKFVGRGVGCLSTDFQREAFYRKSSVANLFNDKVSIPLGKFCASDLAVGTATDQQIVFNVVAQLPFQSSITAASTNYTMSAGVVLTGSLIWVGNINFNVQLPAAVPPSYSGTTSPVLNLFVEAPSTRAAFQSGFGRYRFSMSIPPGMTSQFQLVLNTTQGSSICAVFIKGIGSNFPCVDPDPFGKWGPGQVPRVNYLRSGTSLYAGTSSAVLDFGTLTNIGSDPFLGRSRGDANTMVVEALVGIATNTTQFTLVGTLKWSGSTTSRALMISQLTVPPVPVTDAAFNVSIVDRDEKFNSRGQYVPGVPKRMDIDVQATNVTADINGAFVAVILENANPSAQPFNICCALLTFAGRNFPCLNHTGLGFRTTTTNTSWGTVISTLTFTIGDVCYTSLYPPDFLSTLMTVGVYINVGSYNDTSVGSVSLKATLVVNNVNSTTNYATATLTPTTNSGVINASTAVGSIGLLTSPNVTSTLPPATPIVLVSRSRGVVAFNVCIPPYELMAVEPTVSVADSDTRARATIVKITAIKTGQNLACMPDLSAFKTDFLSSPNLTSSSQKDQAIVRTYYIRNTGVTNKSQTWYPEDDCMTLWAKFEVADHPSNSHNSSISIAVGAKFGSSNTLLTQPVTVQRLNTSEYADIVVNLTVIGSSATVYDQNQTVPLGLLAYHSKMSTREAVDPIIRVIYPPYMDYNDKQVISHNSSYNITAVKQSPYVVFKLPFILFADYIQVNFTLTANPNLSETPQPTSAAAGDGVNATTSARVVCKMQQFASPSTLNPANGTAYYHCGESAAATYLVKAVGCPSVALGMESKKIQDCQITASTSATKATPPQNARPGVSGYWSPALGSFEPYLEIHFGNVTEISSIDFSTDPNGAAVTGYRIMTSFDGFAFSDVENATGSPYTPSGGLVRARFLRFVITATNPDTKLLGLKLEPKGCTRSSDLTLADTCSYVPPTRFTDDIKSWRHVVVDTDNKIVYFCVYHTTKLRTFCYSGTAEGTTWQTCPGYVSYFAGVDTAATPDRVIGVDGEDAAYVYSEDGISWVPLAAADYAAATTSSAFVKSTPVPSHTSSDAPLAVTDAPGWTADNIGISFNGARKVIWSECCN